MPPELAALQIGDSPEVWIELGFVVEHGRTWVSGVHHLLGGPRRGVSGWSMRGVDAPSIDGLPLDLPVIPAQATPSHPNGVVALDHLVLLTPDLERTTSSCQAAGLELRRTREGTTDGGQVRQAFFRLGDVVLEVVGPPEPNGDGPPRFYGLAWTVGDLAATKDFLGGRLRPAKDAVQEGRRIATLDRTAGSSVAMAFMTARPPKDHAPKRAPLA